MDKKGKSTTICYPYICFSVDDYEKTFSDIHVGPQHRLAVEIVAANEKFNIRKSVFSGMVEYNLLRNAVDRAVSSRSSLLKRIWSFSSNSRSPYEFVKMNGPKGKGHAEVAISMEAVEELHSALSGPKLDAASKVPLNCHVTYVEQHVESLVQDILRGTKSPILLA